jgi:Xaa-Pro dipeptidase
VGLDAQVRAYGGMEVEIPKQRGEQAYMQLFRSALETEKQSPGEALVGTLNELGVKKGRVGVELAGLSEHTRSSLKKKLPNVELLESAELIRFIRMVKTKEELNRLTTAAKINEEAMNKSLSIAGNGVKVGDLLRTFLVEVAKNGGIYDHYIFAPNGFGISSNEDYRLSSGEYTSIDVGSSYMSYYADTGTTLVVGKEKNDVTRLYRQLWEIVDQSVEALTPGGTPSQLMRTLSNLYKKAGISDVNYQGHGVGMEAREHPVIAPSTHTRIHDGIIDTTTEIPFEEGMVINIETPLSLIGTGAYQVERTFLVAKGSPKELTPKRELSPIITG